MNKLNLTLLAYLLILVLQPQPQDNWTREAKQVYTLISIPQIERVIDDESGYWCLETDFVNVLMEERAFLGIHLPAMVKRSDTVFTYCEYLPDTYNAQGEVEGFIL